MERDYTDTCAEVIAYDSLREVLSNLRKAKFNSRCYYRAVYDAHLALQCALTARLGGSDGTGTLFKESRKRMIEAFNTMDFSKLEPNDDRTLSYIPLLKKARYSNVIRLKNEEFELLELMDEWRGDYAHPASRSSFSVRIEGCKKMVKLSTKLSAELLEHYEVHHHLSDFEQENLPRLVQHIADRC